MRASLASALVASGMLAPPAHAGPHAEHAAIARDAPAWRPRAALPPVPTTVPTMRVYGYLAWWDDDLAAVPWDAITDLALFSAEAGADGTLSDTRRWDDAATATAMATPYGVRIHLCVTQFDGPTLTALLSDATRRAALVDRIAQAVSARGADGVNIDFENLPAARRADMVSFLAALAARVPDVVLAIPAVDWSDAWDLPALDDHADLFIMGYGYHWGGGTRAGPVDPLFDGPGVGSISLSRTVSTYLADGVDPATLLLGLPLYGMRWDVDDVEIVGAAATGRGSAVFWSETAAQAAQWGARWEPVSRTPWFAHADAQTWFADTRGVGERIDHAVQQGLGGIGFWALNYDDGDASLWEAVRARTRAEPAEPTPDPDATPDTDTLPDAPGAPDTLRVADPLLAYPGDEVVLAAVASSAPGAWRWTQVAGNQVTLSAADTDRPRFVVPAPGAYAFEVTADALGPATAWVVAVDADAGRRFAPCGCAGSPAGAGASGLLLATLALRRRRPSRYAS